MVKKITISDNESSSGESISEKSNEQLKKKKKN